MAKAKKPLTPEQAEIKALKKQKSSMGWTKFWAVLLALLLTVGVVFVGKTTADKAIEAAGANAPAGGNGTTVDGGDSLVSQDEDLLGDMGGDTSGDATTGDGSGDATGEGDDGAAGPAFSKANAHEVLNALTASASKGSYKWVRVSAYTPDGAIDVGNYTSTLDRVIKLVDKNASLNSVVGGFLGIGNKEGEVKNGVIPEDMKEQYALKAMVLAAEDIKGAVASGNTYKAQLNACANPQKDGKNALSRATNDFFTHQEVVDGIAGVTSAITITNTDVQYGSILITAVVDGENLKSLEISYTFSAVLNLKAVGTGITGKGKATNKITYTMA